MKIAVYGTGGVGGYFGGLLAEAGHEVAFIARGAHLEAICKNGLQVLSVNGDFHIHPSQAVDDPAEIGRVDVVIIAVKDYHLESIIPKLPPLFGPGTMIVPLLNGVDAHERIALALGEQVVVGGLCSVVSMIESPGVIRQLSKMRSVRVGELDRQPSERVSRLVAAWTSQGVDAVQPDDIFSAIWTKFTFIASFGGISSLARASMGEIRSCPETRALYSQAMEEVAALAAAQSIRLPADIVQNTLAFSDGLEPGTSSSMQRDVAAGNIFELEAFSGKIVSLGDRYGVSVPVHTSVYGLLKPALLRAAAG
jgi:2-dehydropantoate 2-reductase